MRYQKITIIKSSKPGRKNINEKLQWFGTSLGLFSLRDKDKSCFRIFIELLKAAKAKKGVSSDELAAKLGLTRGPAVHHLKKLIESGMVLEDKNRYFLRVDNLQYLVEEIDKDVRRSVEDLREVAKELDAWLGL
ncbi:MAG: winged helix-turn-helix transcriptional regulator [Candidatus Woesearchaeota archaeon]